MEDALDGIPKHVCGWPIKTKVQIVLTWLVPTVLELLVYIVLIISDISVCVQHFTEENYLWATLTLTFIWLPAVICFSSIITSQWQWPDYYVDSAEEGEGCSKPCATFVLRLIFNLVLFPLGAIYRFCRRLFWSIEALFHDRESYERHQSLEKAAENSPFELYHFLQAFTQAAPQIILQLYILLRENVFRNYDTTLLQALSVTFSLIQMAIIIECYQRFESQRIVGRQYPWHAVEQCQERKSMLVKRIEPVEECRKHISSQLSSPVMEFPDVMRNFKEKFQQDVDGQNEDTTNTNGTIERRGGEEGDVVENDVIGDGHRKTLFVDRNNFDSGLEKLSFRRKNSIESMVENNSVVAGVDAENGNGPEHGNNHLDDDVFEERKSEQQTKDCSNLPPDVDEIKLLEDVPAAGAIKESGKPVDQFDSFDFRKANAVEMVDPEHVADFDTSPSSPPPPLPLHSKILNYPLNRLSTITDMILLNTELYIKQHVPRLPEVVANHEFHSSLQQQRNKEPEEQPITANDISKSSDQTDGFNERRRKMADEDVEVALPRRRRMVVGLEHDDFFGKAIAFIGWALFLLMRMLSLSLFAFFHLMPAFYICIAHYVIMLGCLFYEVKLKEKAYRMLFYFFLAYVYIFSILEFRIKFIHIRVWYGMYIGFVFTQNLAMTVWWYLEGNYDSWWFDYSIRVIAYSGVLSVCCLAVYYVLLKPKDKVFFLTIDNDDEP